MTAGHSLADGPAGYSPPDGRLDTLVVTVAVRPSPDRQPAEAFVLDVRPGGDRWDEWPYVEAVQGILTGRGAAPAYILRIVKEYSRVRQPESRGELSLSLEPTEAGFEPASDDIVPAFQAVLALANRPARTPALRDEAIERARQVVATISDCEPALLAMTEEEHHASIGLWSIGLVSPDRIRYQADVGFVDGNPASCWVRRTHEPEVVDSLDTGS